MSRAPVLSLLLGPLLVLAFAGAARAAVDLSEITVDIRLDHADYVLGEKVRGVVDVMNVSGERICVGYAYSRASTNLDERTLVPYPEVVWRDGLPHDPALRRAQELGVPLKAKQVRKFQLSEVPIRGEKASRYRDWLSGDRLFVEVYRAAGGGQLESVSDRSFVAPFRLEPNEGQKLETFLCDHYGLSEPGHYLARAVLVHGGVRFEGQMRAFDIVPGMRLATALQLFSNHARLRREFALVKWSRRGEDHLFLQAEDTGPVPRRLDTVDLGPSMKVTKPTVSILDDGVVVVLQRLDTDNFLKSEFWSVPGELRFASRRTLQDPETASTNRVRDMYRESKGIQPKKNPWWKFW